MIVYKREQMRASKQGIFPNIDSLYNAIPRDTRDHMERVGRYAFRFYQELWELYPERMIEEFDEEFTRNAKKLFQIHDLGRAYIPAEILNKTSKLTDKEFEIIRNHTIYAASAVESIYIFPYQGKLLEKYLEIALYHHERYEGGGYPEGRVGDAIPFAAQICGIADTYDGIRSWKPYKPIQTSREQAAAIIRSEAGKQFAPWLANCFADLLDKSPEDFD